MIYSETPECDLFPVGLRPVSGSAFDRAVRDALPLMGRVTSTGWPAPMAAEGLHARRAVST